MTNQTDRRIAFLFPGQGGLPESLPPSSPEIERLFEIAASHGLALKDWISNAEADRLSKTDAAQPAILIDSLARDAELRRTGLTPAYVAGHSLGEYSALVSAGAMTAGEALSLVIERGRLMVGTAIGGMAAIVKLDLKTISGLCDKAGSDVVVANHNGPRQVVVSGTQEAVERVIKEAEQIGGRGILLRVSGPFHSPFMEPAQRSLAEVIERISFRRPSVPFVSAVTGAVEEAVARLRELMKIQMTSCVRWVDVIERLQEAGVTHAVELGPGSVLTNLGKRISERIEFVTYEEASDGGV
ncbi:ACP S-malonyltransferase [Candidatus Bipolaricaulota bacterium]